MDSYPPSQPPGYNPQPDDNWREIDEPGMEPALERYEEIGLMTAVLETFQQLLLNPGETFRHFRPDGFGRPIIFMLTVYSLTMGLAMVLNFGLQFAMIAIAPDAAAAGGSTDPFSAFLNSPMGMAGLLLYLLFVLVVAIGFYLVASFINAGIYHLILKMTGDTEYPFETTYRITAYAMGASTVVTILPLCGGLIAAVWQVVILVIGLTEAQRVETWRALLAVLLPLVLCIGLVMAAVVAFVAMIVNLESAAVILLPGF